METCSTSFQNVAEYDDGDSLLPLGVLLLQLLQHVHLQLGRLPVLVHVLDDLQRQNLVSEGEKTQNSFCLLLISFLYWVRICLDSDVMVVTL